MKGLLKNIRLKTKNVKAHHFLISAVSLVVGMALGIGVVKNVSHAASPYATSLNATTNYTAPGNINANANIIINATGALKAATAQKPIR